MESSRTKHMAITIIFHISMIYWCQWKY